MWYLSWVYTTFGRICHWSKCIIILFILRINTIFVCKLNMDKYDKCHIWITFTQHSSRIKSNFSPSEKISFLWVVMLCDSSCKTKQDVTKHLDQCVAAHSVWLGDWPVEQIFQNPRSYSVLVQGAFPNRH